MNREFAFRRAADLIDYLDTLGISDLYLSPLLTARPGSRHGYDVVDHGRVDPELGGEEELANLSSRLRERGMGLLVDIVPNHMCVAGPENRWWNDILESGPSSIYASYFDIEWRPPRAELAGKLLLPILGAPLGSVLENKEIRLFYHTGAFFSRYYDHRFPVAPESWVSILEPALASLRGEGGESAATAAEELEAVWRRSLECLHEPRRARQRETRGIARRSSSRSTFPRWSSEAPHCGRRSSSLCRKSTSNGSPESSTSNRTG